MIWLLALRNNNLKPEEVQDGTYTFTNIGNFGSIMGTPIINQPQVGILAIGVDSKNARCDRNSKWRFYRYPKKSNSFSQLRSSDHQWSHWGACL